MLLGALDRTSCRAEQVEPLRRAILTFLEASSDDQTDVPAVEASCSTAHARAAARDCRSRRARTCSWVNERNVAALGRAAAAARRDARRRAGALAGTIAGDDACRCSCCMAPTTTSSRPRRRRGWPRTSRRTANAGVEVAADAAAHRTRHLQRATSRRPMRGGWSASGRRCATRPASRRRPRGRERADLGRRQIANLARPQRACR